MDPLDHPDPRVDRQRDPDGQKSAAWSRTLSEMDEIAADRREAGWDVLTVRASQTDTVSESMGDDDDYGFYHYLPKSDGEAFERFYDDNFSEYLAYGSAIGRLRFLVIELLDPDRERAVAMACWYDSAFANGMIRSADQEGRLYSYMKRIDGTVLGTFEYEEYGPLVQIGQGPA